MSEADKAPSIDYTLPYTEEYIADKENKSDEIAAIDRAVAVRLTEIDTLKKRRRGIEHEVVEYYLETGCDSDERVEMNMKVRCETSVAFDPENADRLLEWVRKAGLKDGYDESLIDPLRVIEQLRDMGIDGEIATTVNRSALQKYVKGMLDKDRALAPELEELITHTRTYTIRGTNAAEYKPGFGPDGPLPVTILES